METRPSREHLSKSDAPAGTKPEPSAYHFKYREPRAILIAAHRSGLDVRRMDEAVCEAREALCGQPTGDGSGLWRALRDKGGLTEFEARRLALGDVRDGGRGDLSRAARQRRGRGMMAPATPSRRSATLVELLRLFMVLPEFDDGIPRIPAGELAKRTGTPRAKMVALIERKRGGGIFENVRIVERDGKPEYWLDGQASLYLAGQCDTRQGCAVLVALIKHVSSRRIDEVRDAVGGGAPVDVMEMFEGAP